MLRLKGCSRCHGDMYMEPALDGYLWICLQCGNAVEATFSGRPSLALIPVRRERAPELIGVIRRAMQT